MKKIFLFLTLASLIGCQKELIEIKSEEFKPESLPEKWTLILDFQEHHFELESYQVNKQVANTDPLNPSFETEVGRALKFRDAARAFECTVMYAFESQAKDFALGSFHGKDFGITGMPNNPKINFCRGEQNVPVTYKIKKIE